MNNKRQITFLFLAAFFLIAIALLPLSVSECMQGNVFAQSNGELKEGDSSKEENINKKIDESQEKPGGEISDDKSALRPAEPKKPEKINISPAVKPAASKIEKPVKAIPRKEAKDIKETANVKSVNPITEGVRNDDLLDITEGAFKYKRIPGIKIIDPARESSKLLAVDKIEKPSDDSSRNAGEKKGLFGLTIKNTDFLAKFILFGIIIVVFILYRYRTRGQRSSVLKRFPK